MLCKHCKNEVTKEMDVCPHCHQPLDESLFEANQTQVLSEQPNLSSKTLLFGSIGVFLSFLFFFGIPFVHFIGIVLGRQGILYAKEDKSLSRPYSRNGQLLSWIAVGLGVFGIVFNIVYVILNPEVVNG